MVFVLSLIKQQHCLIINQTKKDNKVVKFTTLPGITFYVINTRTNRMLSFGAVEMASQEIYGLRSTKVPTPIVVIKNTPDGAKIVGLSTESTVETIQNKLTST